MVFYQTAIPKPTCYHGFPVKYGYPSIINPLDFILLDMVSRWIAVDESSPALS